MNTYYATVTSKGTVSIPAKIREKLGIKPGMFISFTLNEKTGNAEIIKPVDLDDLRRRTAEHLKRHNKKPLSSEELTKAIDDAWEMAVIERYKRSQS